MEHARAVPRLAFLSLVSALLVAERLWTSSPIPGGFWHVLAGATLDGQRPGRRPGRCRLRLQRSDAQLPDVAQ